MLKLGRFAIAVLPWGMCGFWFDTWRPAWFGGEIRYVTLGLGLIAFYAGDPSNWRELKAKYESRG